MGCGSRQLWLTLGWNIFWSGAPVISSGGSLDKALWKDISLAPPPPASSLLCALPEFPPSAKFQQIYTHDRQCPQSLDHHSPLSPESFTWPCTLEPEGSQVPLSTLYPRHDSQTYFPQGTGC